MKKHAAKESILYNPFTLQRGAELLNFKDVDDFTSQTGISGAVALDLLKGYTKSYRNWIKPVIQH